MSNLLYVSTYSTIGANWLQGSIFTLYLLQRNYVVYRIVSGTKM